MRAVSLIIVKSTAGESATSPVLEAPQASYVLSSDDIFSFSSSRRSFEPGCRAFNIVLTYSIQIPVLVKDIRPPTAPEMGSLNDKDKLANTGADMPGRFYKGTSVDRLLDVALRTEGSHGRLVKNPDMTASQVDAFNKFSARLKTGELVRPGSSLSRTR